MNVPEMKKPEEQTDLIGQDAAEKILLDMWHNDTLAGSWLFCGSKGVGKATLAYRLARFVLSRPKKDAEIDLFGTSSDPVSLNIPQSDPIFNAVASHSHPGLLVVEKALKEEEVKNRQALIDSGKQLDPAVEASRKRYDEIRVVDVREAESFLHLTSVGNGWRVLIVDAADDMNPNAANALLKSLEEPPPKTIMILISHASGKLLPTIRSRCRKLTLRPVPEDRLIPFLADHIDDASESQLTALAGLADGSAGRALELAARNGVGIFTGLLDLLATFPKISVSKLYDFTEKKLKEKDDLILAQEMLLAWLGRVVVVSQKNDFSVPEIISNEKNVIRTITENIPVLSLIDLLPELSKDFADQDLDRRQVFVNAFSKLQRIVG